MPKNKILAVGSVALDSVETPFGKEKEALGGSAVYFSASARFFAPVSVLAVVGEDFPKKYLTDMQKKGIDIDGIEIQKGKTFRWHGFYDFDLNKAHTLKTELNVFSSFVPKISDKAKKSDVLFLANIDPDIQYSVLRQVKRPRLVACDTMNYWIENKRHSLLKLLKNLDIFLCNDAEARELSGEYNLRKACAWISSRGPKIVVIKKGEHGVVCYSKNYLFLAPAFLLEKVFDPTGAGDSFAGGFVGYLSGQEKINEAVVRRAIVYGSVLASYNVESFSLRRLSALRSNEIQARYSQFKNLTRF